MNDNIVLIDVYEKCISKIHGLLEIKDVIGVDDIAELAGDASKVFYFLRKSSNLICQKRFEAFLKGLGEESNPTEEQISKLINYIDDSNKAEYIANMFSKILLSKSNRSCIILGYLTREVTENKDNINHLQLVLIDAITNFFDDDIKNFKFISEYIKGSKTKYISYNDKLFKEASNQGIEKNSLVLTIEKSISHQLIFKEGEVNGDVNNKDPDLNSVDYDEYYTLSSVGKMLYNYIELLKF